MLVLHCPSKHFDVDYAALLLALLREFVDQLGFSVSHFRWSTVRGRFTEAYGGILKSFFKRRIRSPIIKFNVYTIKFIA